LSYRIPARLQALVHPGQLVWVPLRSQVVQGVVMRIYNASQQPANGHTLREIDDIADPEASIPPAGLELAGWLADACHTPLYDALALLLPPGVSQQAEVTWRVTPDGLAASLGALPERERAVLYYLRTHGETSERDIERVLASSKQGLREAYTLLQERGLLARGTSPGAPRARPRRERLVRLLLSPDELNTTLDSLTRAPKQQAVLRWLAAAAQPDVPVSEVYAATHANLAVLQALASKGLLELEEREVWRDPLAHTAVAPDQPPPLTAGQRRVWEPLAAALDATRRNEDADTSPQDDTHKMLSHTFLLHGVTGSGKTEIYLRAVARALRLRRQALVLVPEIALTAQLVRRFAARFPGQLAVLHSHLSAGERYDEWRRLRRGDARLAIGSRSAVFAPLPDLGLIIVDEEHEPSYKHDGSPRYHARDVALQLGALTGSIVMLGSATPSIESYYAAQQGTMTLLSLPERIGSVPGADGLPRTQPLPMPPVRLVDMRHELYHDNRSIFSQALQTALAQVLERGEQAILFLNRRGAASFVMCRDCGHVATCPRCTGSLVVHYDEQANTDAAHSQNTPQPILICHACNYRALQPAFCPNCLSPRIKAFGIGTQRVVEEVHSLFPQARPLRWDRDSMTGKGAQDRMLDQFLRNEANVLVGTQMIAKGLDLPRVVLVGVVAADTGLYLPDFRSGERTFQLLTQVAGRAGRRSAGAQVIIQTYAPEHYALRAAQEHDYRAFYLQEIAFRRQTQYPPFSRLVRFIYSSSSSAACQRAAGDLAEHVRTIAERLCLENWGLIGPAPAFFQRMRGRWRWHVLLRVGDPLPVLAALGSLPGWTVDIDPLHVL
jgi:primosomal protein N' (replication factor Y)